MLCSIHSSPGTAKYYNGPASGRCSQPPCCRPAEPLLASSPRIFQFLTDQPTPSCAPCEMRPIGLPMPLFGSELEPTAMIPTDCKTRGRSCENRGPQ